MNYIPKENNRNRNGLLDTSYQVLSVALSCEVSKSVKGLMKELARNKLLVNWKSTDNYYTGYKN